MIKRMIIGAVYAAALLLGAPALAQPAPAASAAVQPVPNQPDPATYLLGSGDKLRVTVYGEDDLSGEFVVSSTGVVSLPLAGDIPAKGLSVSDFQARVKSALQPKYLKDAQVSIEVLTFRPYYILGEVEKPGEYPYVAGLTVLNAVATAGGFTYRANTHSVLIKHAGATGDEKFPLDSSTAISAGDTVRIGERHF